MLTRQYANPLIHKAGVYLPIYFYDKNPLNTINIQLLVDWRTCATIISIRHHVAGIPTVSRDPKKRRRISKARL